MQQQKLDLFFEKMWIDYCKLNPQAQAVYDSIIDYGEKVVNDHIAFRTFNHSKICVDKLSQHFTKYGYKLAGEYKFKEKKLNAKHFEHSDETKPKVFISELDLNLISDSSRKIIENTIESMDGKKVNEEQFLFSGRPWPAQHNIYLKLSQESEYAAWVYAHGFRPNHFTIYINYLKKLNSIENLNQFLKQHGFKLNSNGGEIKGSAKEYLEQSSTLANEINVQFDDGNYRIPACYYEFAKRYKLENGKLFQGFIGKSADKIFESTDLQK